jgi:hypothetical protein
MTTPGAGHRLAANSPVPGPGNGSAGPATTGGRTYLTGSPVSINVTKHARCAHRVLSFWIEAIQNVNKPLSI